MNYYRISYYIDNGQEYDMPILPPSDTEQEQAFPHSIGESNDYKVRNISK